MKVFLGEKGITETWQEDFTKSVKCHACKADCRIMFVAIENMQNDPEGYVCDLHENTGDGEGNGQFWPHDAIACAVYLCEKCFEPNAVINQA